MPLTILFDLDDTLLTNDINRFLPIYLKALSQHLAPLPADNIIAYLMGGTKQMINNSSPGRTLEEAFDQVFYTGIGIPKNEIAEKIGDFYSNVFPTLKYATQPRPAAIALVEQCLQQGHHIAVATNPLFPRKAILHRLAWANLPAEHYPFEAITSYEYFHFSKPKPAFLAELIAQIGYPEQVVMIGNSLEDDIMPAAKLGLPSFWLDETNTSLPSINHSMITRGGFQEIPRWLEEVSSMKPIINYDTPTAIQAGLLATPAALDTYLKPRSVPNLECGQPQLLFQMIDQGIRFGQLLRQSLKPLEKHPSEQNLSESSNIQQALKHFCRQREDLNYALGSLLPEEWETIHIHHNGAEKSVMIYCKELLDLDRAGMKKIHRN